MLLIVFRVIVGMGEGIIFPSCNTLLAAWTPLKERSITATVVYSGGMLGNIFGSSISGLLISNYGWTSVFYWFSGAAIVWCLVFVSFFYHDLMKFGFFFKFEIIEFYLCFYCSALFVSTIPTVTRLLVIARKTTSAVSLAN